MKMLWILVLLETKRNRKGRGRRLGDIIQIRKRIVELDGEVRMLNLFLG